MLNKVRTKPDLEQAQVVLSHGRQVLGVEVVIAVVPTLRQQHSLSVCLQEAEGWQALDHVCRGDIPYRCSPP